MIGRKLDDQGRRDAWQVTSALLRYPDENLVSALPSIREGVESSRLPDKKKLIALIDDWIAREPIELQQDYVQTFDLAKRCALHVSWFQYGDRRQRGMVLLKLKRRYMEFEMFPAEDELPDWLPLMLEFAAAAPSPEGASLLQEWRAAIELIRRSLSEQDSEYTVLLDLIVATLPKLGANLREAIEKLIEDGPPGDEVGLEPFGPDNDVPSGLAPSVIEYAPEPARQGGLS
jgi:nitrate reductase delta subunit